MGKHRAAENVDKHRAAIQSLLFGECVFVCGQPSCC